MNGEDACDDEQEDAEVYHFIERESICRVVKRVPPLHDMLDEIEDPDKHIVIEEWYPSKGKWIYKRSLGEVPQDKELERVYDG